MHSGLQNHKMQKNEKKKQTKHSTNNYNQQQQRLSKPPHLQNTSEASEASHLADPRKSDEEPQNMAFLMVQAQPEPALKQYQKKHQCSHCKHTFRIS